MCKAAVVSVNGGNLPKVYGDSVFESAGRTSLCGATLHASSTPAGSFFVPDVEVWGKSRQDLMQRRLTPCVKTHAIITGRNTLPSNLFRRSAALRLI